jgi:ADP-ribose pyrophosphatase YjhB (NUDIX family)
VVHPVGGGGGGGSVASVSPDVSSRDLLRWSESLAGVARTGLAFTQSLYERERFEEILRIAADIRAEVDGPSGAILEPDRQVKEWMDLVRPGVPGYATPKLAVGAAVGNDDGELLLIQRADSGVWLYPTGWCDVGYSAAEVVVKEVEEETGIEVEPMRLIAVLDGLRLGFTRIPLFSLVFSCKAVGGTLRPHPLECLDAGWFSPDALPEPMMGVERWGEPVFAALRGEVRDVHYDAVREPMWRGADEVVHPPTGVGPALSEPGG